MTAKGARTDAARLNDSTDATPDCVLIAGALCDHGVGQPDESSTQNSGHRFPSSSTEDQAAVKGSERGHEVAAFELAATPGCRRSNERLDPRALENGCRLVDDYSRAGSRLASAPESSDLEVIPSFGNTL